jgi:hypothetical protein
VKNPRGKMAPNKRKSHVDPLPGEDEDESWLGEFELDEDDNDEFGEAQLAQPLPQVCAFNWCFLFHLVIVMLF